MNSPYPLKCSDDNFQKVAVRKVHKRDHIKFENSESKILNFVAVLTIADDGI